MIIISFLIFYISDTCSMRYLMQVILVLLITSCTTSRFQNFNQRKYLKLEKIEETRHLENNLGFFIENDECDTIFFKNKKTIAASIQSETYDEIYYRRCGDEKGRIFSAPKLELELIKWKDGCVDTIEPMSLAIEEVQIKRECDQILTRDDKVITCKIIEYTPDELFFTTCPPSKKVYSIDLYQVNKVLDSAQVKKWADKTVSIENSLQSIKERKLWNNVKLSYGLGAVLVIGGALMAWQTSGLVLTTITLGIGGLIFAYCMFSAIRLIIMYRKAPRDQKPQRTRRFLWWLIADVLVRGTIGLPIVYLLITNEIKYG